MVPTEKQKNKESPAMGKYWYITDTGNKTYKIENQENKKATSVSIKTTNERYDGYALLKETGFDEKARAKIWAEILALEEAIIKEAKKTREQTTKVTEAVKAFTDYLDMGDGFIRVQPLFYTKQKIWWLWDFETKSWQMVDEIDLLNQMSETIDGLMLFEPQQKVKVLNALKMRGRLATPEEAKKSWVQLQDKVYDITTGTFSDATPKHFITNPIPHKVGETDETPTIDKLFHEWVDEENVQMLYEIIAYCMLPDYPLHRVFCLNGEGRNGKGTFLQLLTNFLGKGNVCSTDFDTLTTRPFESAKLYKKLVCVMGEINSAIFKRTSLFKKLTGSDMIGFEFKGKDGFDEYNYAKLIVATNKLPESTDKTIGFYSRWLIIDFPNIFKEKPGLLDCVPEEEYDNLANKCIRILAELLKAGEFSGEGGIKEKMERYEERASPFKEFVEKACEVETNAETPFWELYDEYVAFLEERGFRKASKRELSHLVKSKGMTTKRVNYTKDSGEASTMIVVVGVSLHHSYTEEERVAKAQFGGLQAAK